MRDKCDFNVKRLHIRAQRMRKQAQHHQNCQLEAMLAFWRMAFLNRLLFLQTSVTSSMKLSVQRKPLTVRVIADSFCMALVSLSSSPSSGRPKFIMSFKGEICKNRVKS